jgi:hypothetical protein|tara:strand:- start:567 stop:722 length:156 start_codon:yes stop_codon:yes gene_type:complete
MNLNRIFNGLVVSLYTIDIYDIVVIQDPDGNCISIRIEEFEDPADPLPLDS